MIENLNFNDLNDNDKELIIKAREASDNALADFSGTYVGASVQTRNGNVFVGANLEYAAFDSICAERAAMLNASAKGERDIQKIALYVRKMHSEHVNPPVMCAKCRVMVMYFQKKIGKTIEILSSCPSNEKVMRYTVNDLLP
jgi:cytidine deaminase